MHKLLVAIGSKVVAEKTTLKAKEEDAWDRMEQQTPTAADRISFAQLPLEIEEPSDHSLGEGFQIMHRWLVQLTQDPAAIPMWLSSYQLYAHFQLSTNHLGFMYNRKSKQFEPLEGRRTNDTYNFIRSAGWFCAMIKCFAKAIGTECTIKSSKPFGSVFRSWQRCLLMPASPSTIHWVHSSFVKRGTTAVHSVHAAMAQYTDFCGGTT